MFSYVFMSLVFLISTICLILSWLIGTSKHSRIIFGQLMGVVSQKEGELPCD